MPRLPNSRPQLPKRIGIVAVTSIHNHTAYASVRLAHDFGGAHQTAMGVWGVVLVQKATEMITNLQQAVKELIQDFMHNNNGFKPERLLFYRDGVSEGQFAHCLELEVPLVQKACMEIDVNFRPPITYVVVQKRHNTRFFPATPGDGDNTGNILPGTVIDTEVCHPFEFDFFLNSHAGLKGTNKPAHYHVLLDQNGFGSDCLQLLTYRCAYQLLVCCVVRATAVVS
jgi:hypothetical protein